jgi:DNA repair exonuclease SbcCD ATPase subunit
VLYLAEVKKQTRGFMGGSKTELKLLAFQHNDQTWSTVPNEEILTYDDTNTMSEGTLLLVNMGNNRQIHGSPELAGGEIVRQLQKMSRLMERGKEEQEKIEQWKQSLTYQSEILNRQKMELDARQEQIEQMEAEFEYLARQRQELDTLKRQLEEQQARADKSIGNVDSSSSLSPSQTSFLQSLVDRLGSSPEQTPAPLVRSLEAMQEQQGLLENHWRALEERRQEIASRQEESERLSSLLEQQSRDLQANGEAIETARRQLQVKEAILTGKLELLARLNLILQMNEKAREMVIRLARGEEVEFERKVDGEALAHLPLEELEAIVRNLQEDLERVVSFVNDQEEELKLQYQTVEELRLKLTGAGDSDRLHLEEELAEEREKKALLEETLIGQRRNLRDRQIVLLQHLQILLPRQGISPTENERRVQLEPVLILLAERHGNILEERQHLESEIVRLQSELQGLQEMIDRQWSEQEWRSRELQEQELQCRSIHLELTRLQARVQLYESLLQPVQDRLDIIRENIEEFSGWFTPVETNGHNLHPFVHN